MAEGTLNVCLWCCWLFGDFDTKNHKPTCCKGYMLYQLLKLNSYCLQNKTSYTIYLVIWNHKKNESFVITISYIKFLSSYLYYLSWLFSIHSFRFLFFSWYICDLSLGLEDYDEQLSRPPESWCTLSLIPATECCDESSWSFTSRILSEVQM